MLSIELRVLNRMKNSPDYVVVISKQHGFFPFSSVEFFRKGMNNRFVSSLRKIEKL